MIATRLNRALKVERNQHRNLCLVLVIIGGLAYLSQVQLDVIVGILILVCILHEYLIEKSRLLSCGNKYDRLLTLEYLAFRSGSSEISDKIAEEWNNLPKSTRQQKELLLDLLMISFYIIPTVIMILLGL